MLFIAKIIPLIQPIATAIASKMTSANPIIAPAVLFESVAQKVEFEKARYETASRIITTGLRKARLV